MLKVRQVTKKYKIGWFSSPVIAVDEVSFDLKKGEIFGLFGKSGSGKSTIARLLLRLTPANKGQVYFHGQELFSMNRKRLRAFRPKMQMIFQQSHEALDPKQSIKNAILEPLYSYGKITSKSHASEVLEELLIATNLSPEILNRKPHQISGGQAQRVIIARALSLKPELLIADEATSMLDVAVQAQILRLLLSLRNRYQLSILLISHDPAVIAAMCDRVGMMENGKMVFQGLVPEWQKYCQTLSHHQRISI